jgi:hypothetical protein
MATSVLYLDRSVKVREANATPDNPDGGVVEFKVQRTDGTWETLRMTKRDVMALAYDIAWELDGIAPF